MNQQRDKGDDNSQSLLELRCHRHGMQKRYSSHVPRFFITDATLTHYILPWYVLYTALYWCGARGSWDIVAPCAIRLTSSPVFPAFFGCAKKAGKTGDEATIRSLRVAHNFACAVWERKIRSLRTRQHTLLYWRLVDGRLGTRLASWLLGLPVCTTLVWHPDLSCVRKNGRVEIQIFLKTRLFQAVTGTVLKRRLVWVLD